MWYADTLRVSWGKRQLNGTVPMWGWRGRAFGPHPHSSGKSCGGRVPGGNLGGTCLGSLWLALTFSLDTWWEKGQVPSVFLQVPRTNLCMQRRGSEGRAAETGSGPCAHPTPAPRGPWPGSHLVHTATFSGSWM